jgi:hypothetical protein
MERYKKKVFSGSVSEIGKEYGASQRERIWGMFRTEFPESRHNFSYAKACWKFIEKQTPNAAKFYKAVSVGADIPLEIIQLLICHEEIVHQEHCTIISAQNKAGSTLMAQSWDWYPQLYPWSGVVELQSPKVKVLSYEFPGLICLGMNDHGLGVTWSGAGYFPIMKPKIGVPAYVIIFELLFQKNINQAEKLLRSISNAGPFMVSIGDSTGNIIGAEALPGKIILEKDANFYRANLFAYDECIQKSKQSADDKLMSHKRMHAVKNYLAHSKNPTVNNLKEILTSDALMASANGKTMTLDSIVLDLKNQAFHIRKGGYSNLGKWQKITF